jgi:outer membrane protein assembly factor BamB
VYALDATNGDELWDEPFNTGNWVTSSPAVSTASGASSNGAVYVGSYDNSLYAIDAGTGEELWGYDAGDRILTSPAVAGGHVYVTSNDGTLHVVDTIDGTETGSFVTEGSSPTSPVVADGAVYVANGLSLYAV